MYDGVQSEVINTTRIDENSDLSMTYLGKIDMIRASNIKTEEKIPIIRIRIYGRKIISWYGMSETLITGASKLFMSKLHYLRCKSLHSLPKFAPKTQRIQVVNGQFVSVLFIIPVQ